MSKPNKAYCHSCEKWYEACNFLPLSMHGGHIIFRAVCNLCLNSGKTLDNLYQKENGMRITPSNLKKQGITTSWYLRIQV